MGGLNLYQYAPNPTGWVDPRGLEVRDVRLQNADNAAGINPEVNKRNKQQNTKNYAWKQLRPEVRGRICQFLSEKEWKVSEAFGAANDARKEINPETGRNFWHDHTRREAENFLYAAENPDINSFGVIGHQSLKKILFWPVGRSSAPSLDALKAGFSGVAHQANAPEDWKKLCGKKYYVQ